MVLHKEGVTGMVDEKVTVISSVVHMYIPSKDDKDNHDNDDNCKPAAKPTASVDDGGKEKGVYLNNDVIEIVLLLKLGTP